MPVKFKIEHHVWDEKTGKAHLYKVTMPDGQTYFTKDGTPPKAGWVMERLE